VAKEDGQGVSLLGTVGSSRGGRKEVRNDTGGFEPRSGQRKWVGAWSARGQERHGEEGDLQEWRVTEPEKGGGGRRQDPSTAASGRATRGQWSGASVDGAQYGAHLWAGLGRKGVGPGRKKRSGPSPEGIVPISI
jgi:hypothetical protein